MQKKLGFTSIVLLGINSIIGSGVFFFPHITSKEIGLGSLWTLLFIAIVVMSLAACFAEAAGIYSQNGGPYVYVRDAFGEFPGFVVGFSKLVVQIITWASTACALKVALGVIWSPARTGTGGVIIVVGTLVGLGIVNYLGVNFTKVLNNVVTVSKIIPILIFIVLGVFFVKGSHFELVMTDSAFKWSKFGAISLMWFYAFQGFESLAIASEDMENPKQNLPRAIMIVMSVITVFYIGVHVLSIGVLGNDLKTETMPIQAALFRMIGPTGLMIACTGTLISIAGINIANSFITPRCMVALAEDKLLPSCFAKESRFGTPGFAIVASTIIAIPVALSGSYQMLVTLAVVSGFIQYISTAMAVIRLRSTKKDVVRPFRLPFGILIPAYSIVASIWLLLQAPPLELVAGLAGLFLAVPFYLAMKYQQS